MPAAAALSLALISPVAWSEVTEYAFTGIYNSSYGGVPVSLGYSGSFTITDPLVTDIRPPLAPDMSSPVYDGIWAGTSTFYTGAANLSITFANTATATSASMGLVVNNTTFSGSGAPYSPGLSVQLYPVSTVFSGMSAGQVCPDGSLDEACDDTGDDPVYEAGDAADLAFREMTGLYFAFYNAPLSTVAAGVPRLDLSFGAASGGLGVFSVNGLGQNVTTLTQLQSLTATVSPSPVPEPAGWALLAAGLSVVLLRDGRWRLQATR
jgi:hypothetical protein